METLTIFSAHLLKQRLPASKNVILASYTAPQSATGKQTLANSKKIQSRSRYRNLFYTKTRKYLKA